MTSRAHPRVLIRSRARGFTLIEVMVALVITAIGLLGIAKIQALAYASTGSAGLRSLVALQAAGLAANMHTNRTYWSGLAPPIVTISDTTIPGSLGTPADCTKSTGVTPCLPATMAAYDLQTYAASLHTLLQNLNSLTTISCAAVAPNPVSCTIQVTWNEHAVSVNKESAQNTFQNTFAPTYMLYVEP